MNLLLLDDLTAFEKLAEACCCLYLAFVGTYLMNLRIEWLYAAVVCLE